MKLYVQFDGGMRGGNPGESACGVVVRTATGEILERYGELIGYGTNNAAEYAGLCCAIEKAVEHGADELVLVTDSQLVEGQMAKNWKVKSPGLRALHRVATEMLDHDFQGRWRIVWVPRERNAEADAVASEALDLGLPSGDALDRGLDLALAND